MTRQSSYMYDGCNIQLCGEKDIIQRVNATILQLHTQLHLQKTMIFLPEL